MPGWWRRPTEGLRWWPVLLLLPARLAFAFLAQSLAAGVLWLAGDATPWSSSQAWWTVYGTLTDLLCLGLLVWLLRQERLRLSDLYRSGWGSLRAQLTAIPVYLLALLPFVAATYLLAIPLHQGAPPPQIAVIDLPAWATVYSVAVWPLLWAFTEQLVYLGYLLPRLTELSGRLWVAAGVVVLVWAVQHIAMPFIPDGGYLLSRTLTALLVSLGMTLVFLWLRRRLLTTTLIHWVADAPTALLPLLLFAAGGP